MTTVEQSRSNYAAYVADRIAYGDWTPEHVAEYRAEVGRIMKSGTDDEKLALSSAGNRQERWASENLAI